MLVLISFSFHPSFLMSRVFCVGASHLVNLFLSFFGCCPLIPICQGSVSLLCITVRTPWQDSCWVLRTQGEPQSVLRESYQSVCVAGQIFGMLNIGADPVSVSENLLSMCIFISFPNCSNCSGVRVMDIELEIILGVTLLGLRRILFPLGSFPIVSLSFFSLKVESMSVIVVDL